MTETKPPPDRIFLQWHETEFHEDTTWCVDEINDEDIAYIRLGVFNQITITLKETEEKLAEALNKIDKLKKEKN